MLKGRTSNQEHSIQQGYHSELKEREIIFQTSKTERIQQTKHPKIDIERSSLNGKEARIHRKGKITTGKLDVCKD